MIQILEYELLEYAEYKYFNNQNFCFKTIIKNIESKFYWINSNFLKRGKLFNFE